MGLGVQPEDLDMDVKIIFPAGETVELVCLDTVDNQTKESIMLSCKVTSGQYAGHSHTFYLSKKRTHPILIRKLREFAKAFYTDAELRSGDQPLSRLYLRKFSAVAEPPREVNGNTYQDFNQWKDLGESGPEGVDTSPAPHLNGEASTPPTDTTVSDDNVPF